MELWSGSTTPAEDVPSLEDLHFVSLQRDGQPHIAPTSIIQSVSLIDVGKVPLYLAAGPSLEVWTGNSDTAQWIEETLSKSLKSRRHRIELARAWWQDGASSVWQSQVGVLLQVNEQGQQTKSHVGPRVTEFVLYGIASNPRAIAPPPSPPPSSSPRPSDENLLLDADLEVYALPISSEFLYIPLNTNIQSLAPPSPPSEESEPCAQFLPTQHSPLKRKRAVALLDDAIKRRRNIQRKGGDGVGLLVTGAAGKKPQVSVKRESADVDSSVLTPIDTTLPPFTKFGMKADLELVSPVEISSRRPCIGSNPVNDRITSLTRLPSRKRSSLHRVSSSISPGPASPLLPPESSDSIPEQNKFLLSRIILAGMRLYGLSRSKERPGSASASATDMPHDFGGEEESKDVDEFKGVYYATYRAASFGLRKSMKGERLVEKEMIRSVVDQLLSLFCDEVAVEQGPGNM